MSLRKKVSIYLHYPYCTSKCTYCNFNKYILPNRNNDRRMTNCLINELKHDLVNYDVKSIYFGGGTPSLASPYLVADTLEYVTANSTNAKMEITMEANPTGFEISKLKSFRDAGVNRLSLGVQSLDDQMLKIMNRDHSVKDALKAIDLARSNFDNVSLDFIWGRPGQTLKQWESELQQIFAFGANHLSLYQLTVERGTALFKQVKSQEIKMNSEDELADMFELTRQMAQENGYLQYEVSSFAKDGLEGNQSQHNKSYWEGHDYIGVGPGAHGLLHIGKERFRTYRILEPNQWMKHVEEIGHGIARKVPISTKDSEMEYLLTSLRTTKGAFLDTFSLIGNNVIESVNMMDELIELGYIEVSYGLGRIQNIRTTQKGLAVADRLVQKLFG
ncbi:radical S-adenosyl methionine domain-containing protein 1 [Boothiomyces sp. JEL0866]|nr:radical S-adenosyl methionine domain-containing protein 1 [Boothiomyces sp. JEL0866]